MLPEIEISQFPCSRCSQCYRAPLILPLVFSDIVIIIIAVKVDSSNVIDDGSGDGNVDDGDCDVVIDDDACGNVGGAIIKDDDS